MEGNQIYEIVPESLWSWHFNTGLAQKLLINLTPVDANPFQGLADLNANTWGWKVKSEFSRGLTINQLLAIDRVYRTNEVQKLFPKVLLIYRLLSGKLSLEK